MGGAISGQRVDISQSSASHTVIKYDTDCHCGQAHVLMFISGVEPNHYGSDKVITELSFHSNPSSAKIAAHELGHLWGINDLYNTEDINGNVHPNSRNRDSIYSGSDKVTRHDRNAMSIALNNMWYITSGGTLKRFKTPPANANTAPVFHTNEWIQVADGRWYWFKSNGEIATTTQSIFGYNYTFQTAAQSTDGWGGKCTGGPAIVSPLGGTYNDSVTVKIDSPVAGGKILYTLTGHEPQYGSPYTYDPNTSSITLTFNPGVTTLKTRTYINGSYSLVRTDPYTVKPPSPSYSHWSGTYAAPTTTTMTVSAPSCDKICYRTDGGTPVNGNAQTSEVYASLLSLTFNSGTHMVKAIAVKNGVSSDIAPAAYTVKPPVPTLSQEGGTYIGGINTILDSPVAGGKILYTLTGHEPQYGSPYTYDPNLSSCVVNVNAVGGTTLKSRVYANGVYGDVKTDEYTINRPSIPIITPITGIYSGSLYVTIASSNCDMIYFTFANHNPLQGDPETYQFSGNSCTYLIDAKGTHNLRVRTCKNGTYSNTKVISYTIT